MGNVTAVCFRHQHLLPCVDCEHQRFIREESARIRAAMTRKNETR